MNRRIAALGLIVGLAVLIVALWHAMSSSTRQANEDSSDIAQMSHPPGDPRAPQAAAAPASDHRNADGSARTDGPNVSGTVLYFPTGEPVAGVEVVALRVGQGPEVSGVSDDGGRYAIPGLLPDVDYYLVVDDATAGYASRECPRVRLKEGESVSGVTIQISSGANVAGLVSYRRVNAPIPGTRVVLHDSSGEGYVRRESQTGEDGRYELHHLPAGQYYLEFRPPKGVVSGAEGETSSFRRTELQADGSVNIDAVFDRAVSVSGRVMCAAGPVADAEVSAHPPRHGGAYSTGKTDAQGDYKLSGLTEGAEYSITAVGEGLHEVTQDVDVETDVVGFNFYLGGEAILAGQVIEEDGTPLPNCTVFVNNILEASADATPDARVEWRIYRRASADDSGKFIARNLPPGTYDFGVARAGVGDTARLPCQAEPVTVGLGETIDDLKLVVPVLEEQFIEGHVRDADGRPLEGVKVAASPNIHDAPNDTTETDASGYYRLDGLGDQPLDVWYERPNGQSLRLRGVPVGANDVDVTFADPGSIAGIVVDAETGTPLSDFALAVMVQLPNSWDRTSPISSGDQNGQVGEKDVAQFTFGPNPGEFTITRVYPGVATIRVDAKGYTTQEFGDIPVSSEQLTSGVRLEVLPASVYEGNILAEETSRGKFRRMIIRPHDDLPAVETVPVDDSGHFYIDDLDPGMYNVKLWFDMPDGRTETIERDIEVLANSVITEDFVAP